MQSTLIHVGLLIAATCGSAAYGLSLGERLKAAGENCPWNILEVSAPWEHSEPGTKNLRLYHSDVHYSEGIIDRVDCDDGVTGHCYSVGFGQGGDGFHDHTSVALTIRGDGTGTLEAVSTHSGWGADGRYEVETGRYACVLEATE